MKIGDIISLEVYAEICCDECGEVIHNHLNCPICGNKYADSNQFCEMYGETEIECLECNSKYKLVEGNWYWYDCKVEIISIKGNADA